MKAGSLFSGYRGLDVAVEAVTGANTVWCSDIDPGANKILAHHWPDVPNIGDITRVDWDSVEPVDVLTGGFPCQDVSAAGKRTGLVRYGERNRSGLWAEMARAIDHLRPNLVIAENVRGLLSAKADAHPDVFDCLACMADTNDKPMRALGAVLGDLAALGYDAAWHGMRASDVGAPHQRFRVFVIAWPTGNPPSVERRDAGATQDRLDRSPRTARGSDFNAANTDDARLAFTGLSGRPETDGSGSRATASGSDPTAPDARCDRCGRDTEPYSEQVCRCPTGAHGDHIDGRTVPAGLTLLKTPTSQLAINGGTQHPDKRKEGGHGPTLADEIEHLLPTPSARLGDGTGRGASHPDRRKELCKKRSGELDEAAVHLMTPTDWGRFEAAIRRWESVTRPAPRPTETGMRGQQRLSPAFVEWMQGLPAGHVTGIGLTRNEELKALGNGVVPQQAEAALRYLLDAVARAA